jgi:dihydropyrimidinase
MLDLIIRGGLVVTPTQTRRLDIGIQHGQIALVAEPGIATMEAARIIDAAGRLVMPGGVEAHAHIAEPMYKGWTRGEEVWLQSPEAATRAAIFGGTTTVVSFAFMDVHTKKVEFDANIAVQDRIRIFRDHAYADFAFHPVLTGRPSPATIATIADAIADGTASFKVFTTDVTSGQGGIKIDGGSILDVMRTVAAHGGIVMAHAEDDELVKHMEAKLAREGRDQWYNLHLVHTNLSERIAFHSIISLAREAGVPLYLAHVTGAEGVAAIAAARAQGQPVFGEVLHNYLCYTADDYQKPDGGKYQTYPALKSEADRLSLWDGLAKGSLAVVATDEYTTSYRIKTQGKSIATACGGHAGIETRGMIAFSEGYANGKFSLERFAEVFSTNPAKVLGMYPQKGAILPGSDADLVLWDPALQKTIRLADLHHDSDYSIWEGWQVQGWPVMTILRGQVVVEGGQLLGRPTDGRFVKRKLQPEMLSAGGA